MDAYQKLLIEFEKIQSEEKQVSFVMDYLQNMAEANNFEDFQTILNLAEPHKFNEAIYTIALVAWWYGDKLNRKTYIQRAINHYVPLIGEKDSKNLFKNIMDGTWEPMFGFERKMFGISKS